MFKFLIAMNKIQIFNNPQFGEIRTAGTSENPLFCLSDLCKCLGLSAKGVNQRLSKEVISNYPLQTAGGIQQALFVNEDGLYDVILDSRKPEARAFRKWVTSEVLPSIRKTGSYSHINPADYTRQDLADLILESEQDLQAQDKVIAEQKDKIKELEEKLERTRQEKIDARFERVENVVAKMAGMMMQGIRTAPVLPETAQTATPEPQREDDDEEADMPRPMLVHEMRMRIKEEHGVVIPYRRMFSLLAKMGWAVRNERYINRPGAVAVRKGYVLECDSKGVKGGAQFFTLRITEKGYRKFVDEVIGKGGLL